MIIIRFLAISSLLLTLSACQDSHLVYHLPFNQQADSTAQEAISQRSLPVEYVFNQALYKPDSDPLWRTDGIKGGCLLFDGYSTYVEDRNFRVPTEMTLSVWVAPRAFEWEDSGNLAAIASQIDSAQKRGFVLGLYRHGAWGIKLGDGEHWLTLLDTVNRLPLSEWSFLSVSISSEGARLFLNGQLVKDTVFSPPFGTLMSADTTLIIGRHGHAATMGRRTKFYFNMFAGLMDELTIRDLALSESEIQRLYASYPHPPVNPAAIRLDFAKFEGDRFRPQYHALPPAHWMNEPHAPFYYNGKYHLFYQHNPLGPFWHQIHWGHWVSDDMIHWQHTDPALAPSLSNYSPNGIWSGCAYYLPDGTPALYFTAGNFRLMPTQAVAIATPANLEDPNLVDWRKPDTLAAEKPEVFLPDEFRDPFVWEDHGYYWMMVGTGIQNQGGSAALFRSTDAIDWEYMHPIFQTDFEQYPYLGLVWELPVILPLGTYPDGHKRYVFLISPVRDPANVEIFYWLGRFDSSSYTFVPEQEAPQLIDYGDFGFTGPSGMIEPKSGRAIVFSIAQGKQWRLNSYEMGWAHNAGLPMHLFLDEEGTLRIQPIEEVRSLRGEKLLDLKGLSLAAANEQLASVRGDMLEIRLRFGTTEEKHGLWLRQSPDREEETLLFYEPDSQQFGIDRSRTTLWQDNAIDQGPLALGDEPFNLRVFLDKSMLEAYANQRRSITSRTYCSREDALGLTLFGPNELPIESLEIWRMGAIEWGYVGD